MKIMIVVPYFYPKIGGLENYALNIARGLKKEHGHTIVIVTSGDKGSKAQKQKIKGMAVYRLPYSFKLSNTPIGLRWKRQIAEIIAVEKPAIINAYTPVPFMADMAERARGTTPFILSYANDLTKSSKIGKLLAVTYNLLFTKRTLRKSDLVIALSQLYVDSSPLLQKYQDKISIIPPGVDIQRFNSEVDRQWLEKKYPGKKIVLSVASMKKSHGHKGIDVLIKAIAKAKKEIPNIQLVAVGTGDAILKYKQIAEELLISDIVDFPGFVTDTDLPKYYAGSHVFVLPSTNASEGFGMVIAEAMACGTPVIGTNVGGIPFVINDNKNGILVPPNDSTSLSKAIERVLSNKTLVKRLKEASVERVASEFMSKNMIDKTMDVIKSVNNKKIDYINSFPLVLDEAESIHVYELCKNFQKLNCNVRLFSPKSHVASESNFQQVDVKCPNIYRSIFFQLLLLPKIIKLWHNNKPDFIYTRVSILLIMPTILSIIYKIPLIVEINGTIEEETADANYKLMNIFIKLGILRFIEQKNYNRSSKIITVTPGLKKYLINKFKINGDKIYVVENGVDADLFKPNSKSNKKVIGYIGGMRNWQGLSYVIQAMPDIISKFHESRLVMVGDGPNKSDFEKLVKELNIDNNVEFIGALEHNLTPKYINSFDICVAYYKKDRDGITSPFKVYEYLSSGKPTIVSNIKGVGDIFGNVAIVVEPENSAIFAKKVINLFNDEAEQDRLSKAGREFVLDGHSWHDVAEKTLDIITG